MNEKTNGQTCVSIEEQSINAGEQSKRKYSVQSCLQMAAGTRTASRVEAQAVEQTWQNQMRANY